MRVLVTGASGFVGAAACQYLRARGHAVRVMVRHPRAQDADAAERVLVPDLASISDWRALFENIEVVVHLAAIAHRAAPEAEIRRVNVDAAARLADAAAGLVRRFVFMSSVKVHGEDSGEGAYVEASPTRPEDAYGRSKLEAEHALGDVAARTGMEIVAIRPPLVYGPGAKANFLRLLRGVDSGWPLPFASVRNRRRMIYLGNLADAIARCVEHPGASGAFLVGDDEIVSTPELLSRAARALGRPSRLLPFPPAALRLAAAMAGRGHEMRRLTGNLVIDSSRARVMLGWRPPHTLDRGLAATALWFRSAQP